MSKRTTPGASRAVAKGEGPELRRSRRCRAITIVWYKLVPEAGEPTPEGLARSVDISTSGLGILVPSPVATGRLIWLELTAGQVRLSALGKTVFSAREREYYRVGVEFVVVPPNDRMQLREFCKNDQG